MTECTACRDQIDLRLDGMLDAAAETRLNTHLSQCPACRDYAEAQRILSSDLATLSRVADTLASPQVARSRQGLRRMRAGRVAAALAFAVLCTWAFVRRPSPQPQPERTPSPIVVQSRTHEVDAAPPRRFVVSITPTDGESRFTIPIETENPRIHMVWLCDAVSPDVNFAPSSAPSS